MSNQIDGQAIPLYTTGFDGFLADIDYDQPENTEVKPSLACFNCLGDHNMSDCTERKDFRKIAKNRRAFFQSRPSNKRYHKEIENQFAHIQPGNISGKLREALGLRSRDAPEFIYRMRYLGYPPGWLKEAEVQRSTVSLIDGEGQALVHPDKEDGEVAGKMFGYEPDKLVSFPGFNVPFTNGETDDYHYYGCPRMNPDHSREEFERYMKKNKAKKYKKTKLQDFDTPKSKTTLPVENMDLEELPEMDTSIEFNPPLPLEDTRPPPPAMDPEDLPNASSPEDGELSDASTPAPEMIPISSVVDNSVPVESADVSAPKLEESTESTNGCPEIVEPLPSPCGVKGNKRLHRSRSKGFVTGIPIPDSVTEFSVLPTSDKWAANISDTMSFENLPDAVGKWNRMRSLMSKVRLDMAEIQDD